MQWCIHPLTITATTVCIYLCLLTCFVSGIPARKYVIKVSPKDDVKCKLSKRFLSVALDAELLQNKWSGVDFSSDRLKNLLIALQPAYLRVGGSAANNLMFNPEVQGIQQTTMSPYLLRMNFTTQSPPLPQQTFSTTPPTIPTAQVFNVGQMQMTPTTMPTIATTQMTLTTVTVQGVAQTTMPPLFNAAQPAVPEATTTAYPTSTPYTATTASTAQTQATQATQATQQTQATQATQATQQTQATQATQQTQATQATQAPQTQNQQQPQQLQNQQSAGSSQQEQLPNTPPPGGVSGAATPPPYGKGKGKKKHRSKGKKKSKGKTRGLRSLLETESSKYGSSFVENRNNSQDEEENLEDSSGDNMFSKRDSVYQFNGAMFDKLANFAKETSLSLVFALNEFTRDQDNTFNSNNANQLIQYAVSQGYQIDWELGNEPDKYSEIGSDKELSAEEVADDFLRIRAVVDSVQQGRAKLIGPDIGSPPDSLEFLKNFLPKAHSALNVITWHHYYMDGKQATLEDYVNPEVLEGFRKAAQSIHEVVRKTKTPLWVGESGDCWNGGTPEISNSYAAGFMFLDKLGLAALYCNAVLIQNGLIGGNYAMLGEDYVPNPNYWISFIFKQLVGRRVLNVGGADKVVRVYAHCAKRKPLSLPKGSVVVFGINLQPDATATLSFKDYRGKEIDEYLLTAPNGNLKSQSIDLNGQTMKLGKDNSLPQLVAQKRKSVALIPPLAYGFFVIKDAKHRLCN